MEKRDNSNLYQIISCAFCVIVVISNIISAKMFKVPFLNLSVPAGLLTYPLTFLLSDLTTEIFGSKKSKLMVYMALGMSLLAYTIIQGALLLPSSVDDKAFSKVLGINGLLVIASLIAYVLGQILDIQLYARIKKWTGEPMLWLRNNGSTLVSQIVDTIVVNTILLYWGLSMPFAEVLVIMLFSYLYKAVFSLALTPLFYFSVYLVKGNWKNSKILSELDL
jgi:uncharacterized integral membrane protein (TIGR00697 family)